MPVLMKNEMENVGRTLSRWKAELRLVMWASVIMACLWVFSLSDIFVQFERTGRVSTWCILIILISLAIWRINRILSHKWTVLGVAATVELAFPKLDNHLINYIQFGMAEDGDPIKKAYVRQGVPQWSSVKIDEMKNRRAHLIGNIILALMVVILIVPWTLAGKTWLVSMWRIVNPFSNTPPVSLTNIVGVTPGSSTILQGTPVVLACKVKGRKGHHVLLDVKPSDNEKVTYDLGKITSSDIEEFPYRIPKLNVNTEYRFRAGDSPFPKWFNLESRPPLAFTKIEIKIDPPPYTHMKSRIFDGLGDAMEIPQGSDVSITLTSNNDLTNALVLLKGDSPVTLSKGKDDRTWSGKVIITGGNLIKCSAFNKYAETVDAPLSFDLLPDREPVIQVLSPKGKAVLTPGGVPSIQFSVQDDYGLTEVSLERVPAGSAKQSQGELMEKWPTLDWQFTKDWKPENIQMEKSGEPLVFRVVVKDCYPYGARRTVSPAIVFDAINVTNAISKEAAAMTAAAATLGKIIELQKKNLQETTQYKLALEVTKPDQWNELATIQQQIRDLAAKLVNSPINLLGSMTPTVRKLYLEEMLEAVSKLKETVEARREDQALLADKCETVEKEILRKLTFAELASEKGKVQKKMSGLMGMLENLIKGQSKVLADTQRFIKTAAAVGKPTVDQQDSLATDISEFIKACKEESENLKMSDAKFSGQLATAATSAEGNNVRGDMLSAAEKLEANTPDKAVAPEESALTKLRELQKGMNEWQVASAEDRLDEMREVMTDVRDKMGKLATLQGKVAEASALAVNRQNDKNDQKRDLMEDEEVKELKRNMKEALLEVPTDLQVFPELSVANELVDDVISGFEEVEQFAGSEKWGKEKVTEIAELKPEGLQEVMKKASDRIDSMDQWLMDEPDTFKWNSENFDKEETAKSKMSLGALQAAAEDLVGDLLEKTEEMKKEASDSASNVGMPDPPPPGWEPMEGSMESFGAQGKSGNQEPDHKESGGRGNIGRQGMANGEAAAASGNIGEGDPNIEERFTPEPLQSGQIQADGKADTKATGGGKLGSGSADDVGMTGTGKERRMDATAGGSMEGLKALEAKAGAMYAKASALNLRTDSLGKAAHHIKQANDAVAQGLPISEVRELQKKAIAALKKAQTELGSEVAESLSDENTSDALKDVVDGGTDLVPKNYRDLVSEYYKSLNNSL